MLIYYKKMLLADKFVDSVTSPMRKLEAFQLMKQVLNAADRFSY